jgi:hypothetical protein
MMLTLSFSSYTQSLAQLLILSLRQTPVFSIKGFAVDADQIITVQGLADFSIKHPLPK